MDGFLGLDGGGGIMRGIWICWILVLESGREAGLSGLKVIPESKRKRYAVLGL